MNSNAPTLIIFDVDGVLVDVRESFHRSILETVRHFTGRRVSRAEIQHWKHKSGFNDDWRLSTAWIHSLGGNESYAEVKRQFQKFYWGDGKTGNVARERWLVSRALLRRWARRAELALFTGRTREELRHTLNRFRAGSYFKRTVTMDDVRRPKPDPEGLRRLLDGRDPASALYVGDNIDDALAAKRCGVAFVAVLPHNRAARRLRSGRLHRLGAETVLGGVNELDKWLR